MRTNLGSKRREIPDDAREEIVRIYHETRNGNGDWGEYSKVFATTDFGYREIRVERPLRLNFEASEERLERLIVEGALIKHGDTERDAILVALKGIPNDRFMDRPSFEKVLKNALKSAGLKVSAKLKKLVLSALSERDEEAEACLDKEGNPEPDPELRNTERVPLLGDWHEYFEREVIPFVPDAWVDTSRRDAKDGEVGRVGYEINFTRYFYKYVPPRPLEEVEAELKVLEAEIAGLLKEVAV